MVLAIFAIWTFVYVGPFAQALGVVKAFAVARVIVRSKLARAASRTTLRFSYTSAARSLFSSSTYALS